VNKPNGPFLSIRLMFQDEARFGCINDTRRCWAPPGMRPHTCSQFVREYTYVFAAASPHDGTLDTLILPTVDAQAMSIFLAEVSQRHPDDLILMVLDGAGWHRANDLYVPDNIRLISLPPYSPELNPVEHLWDELREKWLSNHVFDSLSALEHRLMKALHTLEWDPQRIKSMMAFPWIVNISLNAT